MDLGLERAGWECRWQVENNEWCQRILAKHWPDVTRYGDIREVHDLAPVDLVCGGFPCQPVSHAGRRKGQEDVRWLWPEFARVLGDLRPRFAVVENVPGLLSRGMGDVLGDLAALGYDAEWDCLPAAAVGAPHLRYRVFIVAHNQEHPSRPDSDELGPHRAQIHEHGSPELRHEQEREPGSLGQGVADPTANNYETEPDVWMARREREKAKHQNGNGFGLTLAMAAQADSGTSGKLNPEWVDWLMGFPLGWTDLEDSGTQSFPKSQSGSDDD